MRVPVATGSNRQNFSSLLIGSPVNRVSQQYVNVLPAGAVEPIPFPGTTFYLGYAAAPVAIRPKGGVFNLYLQGTGIKLEKGFTSLEIQNANAFPVLVQVFIGFDEFIDNRVIIDYTQQPLVAVPVCDTASSKTQILCPDLSTQAITDINGRKFWAIAREALYVFNPDTGVTLLLQKSGANTSSGPAVGAIYPQTTLRYPASGDYSLALGGAVINAIVSDVYYSLPRT